MAKKSGGPEKISLKCTGCERKNYTTMKNKKNAQGKLELMKFCKFERKHVLHKEAKVK